MEIHYTPRGVCSRKIDIVVEDGVIQSVKFTGGCSGNTQGVAALARGMKVKDYLERCKGICCGSRPTSCPDQLAQGMKVEDYIARCKDIKCGFKPTSCPAQLAQALSEALQNG